MMRKLKTYYALLSTEVASRASVIKIKINGQCVNRCAFCQFHSDRRRLEVEDLTVFFDKIQTPRYKRIDINGGEPTLHPHFSEICDFLKDRFEGKTVLYLGTNLIPLARRANSSATFQKRYEKALNTFDVISVGCDDEHGNIEALEQLGPEIIESGRLLFVNVVKDYCSPETKQRILSLQKRLGMRVTFSDVHHFYTNRQVINDTTVPCNRRAKELLMNCNGDAYFCFHQELEQPLFNLFTVTSEALHYFLNEHVPEPYRFCACCPCYRPHKAALLYEKLKKIVSG
ncbi:MAG: radical SAM protein [Deltaproteobacteria bacterium]|nr:radical SAM protein [Deltaproteobacteria bacterium]